MLPIEHNILVWSCDYYYCHERGTLPLKDVFYNHHQLGNTWKTLVTNSNENLGIDQDYTHPDIEPLLQKLEQETLVIGSKQSLTGISKNIYCRRKDSNKMIIKTLSSSQL